MIHVTSRCASSYIRSVSGLARQPGRNFSTRVRSASRPSTSSRPPAKNPLKHFIDEEAGASVAPLPILPRPLGVPDVPSSEPQTWQERREELLDRDKHLEKRRLLLKQATSGYFEDYHKAMRNGHGGKTWLAPKVLIREDKSLYFPDVSGKNLLGDNVHTTALCKGRISIIAFMSTQVAEEHVKSYTELVVKHYLTATYPDFTFVQINLQENLLKSAIVSLSRSSIKTNLPESLHETYIHSSQNMEMLREPLGLDNKHLGFVYLVDENLKIRWAGCGYAKDEERAALMTCTRILLERLGGKVTG